MYTHLTTLCALLSALLPTLAEPNQSVSLAGRRHGLRRSGLCNRAGRDGGRGSAHSVAASSANPSTSVKTQVASQATVAEPASAVTPTTAVAVSSAASPVPSSGTPSTSDTATGGKAALTPNGIKAAMTLCTGLDEFTGKLGWCYGMSTS
jgi:hypothetical protein